MNYEVTSPKYTTHHTVLFWVPFWPPRHTECIIKWVPAGVWCPGERGENKACWKEKTPLLPVLPSFPCLSSLLPPPSNSLSMPSHDEGAVRASLLDLTHQGERQPHKEQHSRLEKPWQPSVMVGNLYCSGDVRMNCICTYSMTLRHTPMHSYVCSMCTKKHKQLLKHSWPFSSLPKQNKKNLMMYFVDP